ncbi:protein FAM184A isoform X3 [Dendroctonus ponderosae]|uniref:protein FAM184A isoform X3 n=1 Tax=Dendroctonus ponderosae TaxID=77166 RepID=UPI0020350DC4|nr:protein FAM184A isoform X3 [Dendroctonus ponderosae]
MSFVKKMFNKMGGGSSSLDNPDEIDDDEDLSETTSEESDDTGVFSPDSFSPANSNSDMEAGLNGITLNSPTRINSVGTEQGIVSIVDGLNLRNINADCSTISNFFGYWKNLINQEAKFQSQLNDLTKELSVRDAEATKLRFQMDELQRDVFAKSAGMDRLQTELNSANKESEIIRQKIRHLENELENYRKRNADLAQEIENKSDSYGNYEAETQSKISELEGVIKNLRIRIETLEDQINELKEEKQQLEAKHAELQSERDEERKRLAETLETTTKQKEEIEKKWKTDFEKLRTVNIVKEQDLLDDFEWKLREVQQMCKKKLDEKEKLIEERLQGAYKEAEQRMEEAQKMLGQVEALKSYETEVKQLRNQTSEQEKALQQMRDQQAQMMQAESNLKNETRRLLNLIEIEKENLQHIQRIHRQELLDKERKLKDTLNQKRTEIAMYWEEKLLTECGRLKDEMEQIHNEEKYIAMEAVRKEKEAEFQKRQTQWESKMRECLKEIDSLKKALDEKDDYYHEELITVRSNTDRDIMELRRLMNKIDMTHHDNYEKLALQHEEELEKLNAEHEQELKDIEEHWRRNMSDVSSNLEKAKEQLEKEGQQKMESLVEQHRGELDSQWENLIHQKSEAIKLVEDEYVLKYKTLEEQFYAQQKSHGSREIELLKAIDALKNEIQSKDSTLDDLQNNVETLEGGVQVLNQEIAQQNSDLAKVKTEAEQKVRSLHETIAQLLEERDKEQEAFRLKLMGSQKQSQETIEHLQRKVTCLTKLFEEVRQRYERRESRQEDLNIISDLKQVVAEQEKDLACINEEKRYFQMRLMQLERHLERQSSAEEDFEDAESHTHQRDAQGAAAPPPPYPTQNRPNFLPTNPNDSNPNILIPPTIPEGDE